MPSPLQYDGNPVVAVVFDVDGNVYDYCYTWEAGQNYALSSGLRVVAIAPVGSFEVPDMQALFDAERERYRDCFGEEN